MEMKAQLRERLESMSEKLKENQAFLQSYMLDPNEDNRPAEEERIKEILAIAGDMEGILEEIIADERAALSSSNEDINIEFKTHTLGCPDGESNIEGDWNITEEEMPALDEFLQSEDFRPVKEKKGKKHKKGKKEKKGKKSKK